MANKLGGMEQEAEERKNYRGSQQIRGGQVDKAVEKRPSRDSS